MGCTFDTGSNCTFKTSKNCTFNTGKNCTISLFDISTCKFKNADGVSIILDREDSDHYLLDEELLQLIKVMNL